MSDLRIEQAMLAAQHAASLIEHFRNIEINAAFCYRDNAMMPPAYRRLFLVFRDAGRAGLRMLNEPIVTPWSTETWETHGDDEFHGR